MVFLALMAECVARHGKCEMTAALSDTTACASSAQPSTILRSPLSYSVAFTPFVRHHTTMTYISIFAAIELRLFSSASVIMRLSAHEVIPT